MTPAEFRAIRKALGLSQEKLAEAIGVQRRQVIRYEQGHRSISGTVAKLMRILEKTGTPTDTG